MHPTTATEKASVRLGINLYTRQRYRAIKNGSPSLSITVPSCESCSQISLLNPRVQSQPIPNPQVQTPLHKLLELKKFVSPPSHELRLASIQHPNRCLQRPSTASIQQFERADRRTRRSRPVPRFRQSLGKAQDLVETQHHIAVDELLSLKDILADESEFSEYLYEHSPPLAHRISRGGT